MKATHSVAAGKVDDFKKLASEMIDKVEALSDELREAVAPFGANISGHWNGFTR